MKSNFLGYQCSLCGGSYAKDEVDYACPKDGGNLDVVLDYAAMQRGCSPAKIAADSDRSLWRYLPLLPVVDPGGLGTPLRTAGGTPVFAPGGLAKRIGLRHLWIKDESRNPTASLKDRASAIVLARAREIGAEVVVTASSGNAGAALAGMAAALGHRAVVLAPKTAPAAKIAQLLIFGARVLLVDGSYSTAFDLSIQAAQEFGWYCRNTGYNPFTAEGKKTAALEIWEWLVRGSRNKDRHTNECTSPLSIFVSVGDGNIISGIHKGFKDLQALGWLGETPRIFGVQAEGSAAIANAFYAGTETISPVSARTLADSISVDVPRDGVRALRACRETGGTYLVVSDDEILDAIVALGKAGIFAEPAGAASFAGLVKAVGMGVIGGDDPVLVINTGSGLKDVQAALRAAGDATIIEPTLAAVRRVMR